ncbi:MAG: hypothetical protein E1N59_677 [Puniceicoccaceae bacterium 5H]|nr:MAG: hypothetical protein E1N59_677 [Puniceicoccaceae bacterium 5H]
MDAQGLLQPPHGRCRDSSAMHHRHTQFLPGQTWTDTHGQPIHAHGGGVLYHEGTYWWFGEHKVAGPDGNRAMVGVHVYASEDLLNWRDAGIALSVDERPDSEIEKGCIIERPKVLYNARTHRFVMWFHLEPKSAGMSYDGARSGVAVAERPEGPYRFLHSLRPNAGMWPENVQEADKAPLSAPEQVELARLELGGAPVPWYPRNRVYRRDLVSGQMARDMTLFLDVDGRAYHLYASENNGTLHVSLLDATFTRPAGRYVRVFPGRFHEAPALMRWNDRYWLFSSDCTGWAPNTARLSSAPQLWGPWTEHGNPCLGTGAQIANSFASQPTFVLPVQGRGDAFVYMADRWCPQNPIDGRYVWLPVRFRHGLPILEWCDAWSLDVFASAGAVVDE